jgi:hypothetical protein
MNALRRHRCLLVIDGLDKIMADRGQAGDLADGYKFYGELFHHIALGDHRSCLLLTSRKELHSVKLWRHQAPSMVCLLSCHGLDVDTAVAILRDLGLGEIEDALPNRTQLRRQSTSAAGCRTKSSLDDTRRIETVYLPQAPGMLPAFGATNHLPFVLKAIAAMHNRVAAEKVTPTRQQRRAYQRQYSTPLAPADYWILKVKRQTPQRIEEVGQGEQGRRPQREHQVRGHFRYYTEERPLFGRYSGMIWVPDHERGSDQLGHIQKDYDVGG